MRGGAGGYRLGVLGGIGPEASALFYRKLIEHLQKEEYISSNEDYPQIIINSIPAPELTSETITDEMLSPYYRGIQELERFGVDCIVLVCNTIHLYHEQLQQCIRVPILDLREAVARELVRRGIRRALLIGTPLTVKRKLYHALHVEILTPTGAELSQLAHAILAFNRGEKKQQQGATVKKICLRYVKQGVEIVIAGCTEFTLMLQGTKLPIIDTLDILVDLTINRMQGGCYGMGNESTLHKGAI